MSHLPFTLLAYFFNSISVTTNKILLNKTIPDPFVYVFYISVFSLVTIFALPFTQLPPTQVLILASFSTILWSMGIYFMFKALKIGLTSRVIPTIGTLIPLILLIYASKTSSVNLSQTWAICFLILGLIFITILDWKGKLINKFESSPFKRSFQASLIKKELIFEIISSILFAISYILLRQAFLRSDFISVLVYSKLILIPLILFVFLTPFRKSLFAGKGQILGKAGAIFILGQASGGASELLLQFSISLATPALVNSLAGTQYIFLIIFGFFLKEKYTKLSLMFKLLGIAFIGLGLYILAFTQTVSKPKIGLTYSPKYAISLGLDPKSTFTKILSDLNVKTIRLPVYWDEVEKFPGQLNFSSVDHYLNEASDKNVSVVLSLGYKQPRWPECFDPPWVKGLIRSERDLRILKLIQAEIEHFKNYKNIVAWQVENEPFLTFGSCDPPNQATAQRLKKEVDIVRIADSRPILITDSGELGFWLQAVKTSDIFGTTIYKQVWTPILGMFSYPLPPVFYTLKNSLVRFITHKESQTIISELQMEPWIRDEELPSASDLNTQIKDFPASKISENLEYAKETNFNEIYLWGVEWWYFMDKAGHPEYLEKTKNIF